MKRNIVTIAALLLAIGCARAQTATHWDFKAEKDAFDPAARFDLRYLNEAIAGEKGFIRRSDDGASFVTGDGKPIRFWSVTEYTQRDRPEQLAHHARWLAKRGVNMVRFHGQISPVENQPLNSVNEKEIDECWRLVAEMKKQGIYTTISPFWAIPFKIKPHYGVVAADAKDGAFGLLFWDAKMQAAYKEWLRQLFARPNPYTKIPLAKDPAVALIQLQNEDSLLFWTMQAVKGEQLRSLGRLFAKFAARKYGTIEKALAAWDGNKAPGDEISEGVLGIYPTWEFTQERVGGHKKRLDDQLQFFGETMYAFNQEMGRFLREELGCKQLVNAGNWKSADPIKLEDVERWSYTANDVIAVNKYFTGVHKGPDEGWAIREGDIITNESALLDPRNLPINVKQPVGYPFLITESEWVYPNLYQSEGPFLTAAYLSLTGVDSFYWFGVNGVEEWHPPLLPKIGEWQPPLGKWSINTPMQMGQFPAAALLFRKGYVREGMPVLIEKRELSDLWQRKMPRIAEDKSFDPNRDAGSGGEKSATVGAHPLSFLVGPVMVLYGGKPFPTAVIDPAGYIDDNKKVVQSVTKEVRLNYDKGVCTINAPKAQGVCGFLSKIGGPLALKDVTITSQSEYASILCVPLDDKPIASTKKLLIQIGTTQRPTGWKDTDAADPKIGGAKRIVAVGGNPWRIATLKASVVLSNPGLSRASVLDANGMSVGAARVARAGGKLTVTLPPDALYVIVE